MKYGSGASRYNKPGKPVTAGGGTKKKKMTRADAVKARMKGMKGKKGTPGRMKRG
jgi:hypothetical protein